MTEYQSLMNLQFIDVQDIDVESMETTSMKTSTLFVANNSTFSGVATFSPYISLVGSAGGKTNIVSTNTDTVNAQTYYIPTVGDGNSFVMTNGNSTINGAKTFSDLNISNNIINFNTSSALVNRSQLVIPTTTGLAALRTVNIPDTGNVSTSINLLTNNSQFTQTVLSNYIFNALTSFNATTNQIKLYNATISAPSATARTITIPEAGANSSIVLSEGAQTINGVKTFSNIVTSAFRFTTAPTAGLVLTSDATGNASWVSAPAPTNMVSTNTTQTLTAPKTFTNPIVTTNINNVTGLSTTYYNPSETLLRTIPIPSDFGSSVSIYNRITGSYLSSMTGAENVTYAGLKIYTNSNIQLLTLNLGTLVGLLGSFVNFDVNSTVTISSLQASDFPLKAYFYITNGFYFTPSAHYYTLNYSVPSITTNTLRANNAIVDSCVIDNLSSLDSDNDNFIVGTILGHDNSSIKIKLKDIVNLMFAHMKKSTIWDNFTIQVPLYMANNNQYMFADTDNLSLIPNAIEIKAKLKADALPCYVIYEPGGGINTPIKDFSIGPFLPNQTVTLRRTVISRDTNLDESINPFALRANTLLGVSSPVSVMNMWDRVTQTYSTSLSRYATMLRINIGTVGSLSDTQPIRFSNLSGTTLTYQTIGTMSGGNETRDSVLDYFETFQIRGLRMASAYTYGTAPANPYFKVVEPSYS